VTRTTNAAESNPPTARIPALWARFGTEGWAQKLEQLGGFGPVTAVYSAYEGDVSGSYQLLVGREVRNGATLPEPLQTVSTQPGAYLAFRCNGPLPQAVINGWDEVWTYFARPAAPLRAYTYDFEIYGPVEIWVAIPDR
jgi:predicted transcriptional regulator YdeE